MSKKSKILRGTSAIGMTKDRAERFREKLESGTLDHSADEMAEMAPFPLEGEIKITFKCIGAEGDEDHVEAGVVIDHYASFGDWNAEDIEKMLEHPKTFLEMGDVAGIGACLMGLILAEDGVLSAAVNMQQERAEAAREVCAKLDLVAMVRDLLGDEKTSELINESVEEVTKKGLAEAEVAGSC